MLYSTYAKEGFALLPVCTLYVRADGLGPPISRQNQPTDGYFKALPENSFGCIRDIFANSNLIILVVQPKQEIV